VKKVSCDTTTTEAGIMASCRRTMRGAAPLLLPLPPLLLLLTHSWSPVAAMPRPGATGLDVASAVTAGQWNCSRPDWAIVRAWHSFGAFDAAAPGTVSVSIKMDRLCGWVGGWVGGGGGKGGRAGWR
jgi:hypothetical protein